MPLSATTVLELANPESSTIPWRWGAKDILDDLALGGLSKDECDVINWIRAIYEKATGTAGSLVLKGAHVKMNDKGAFYTKLVNAFYSTSLKGGVRENKFQLGSEQGLALTSSHYKDVKTGKIKGDQFVQMEIRFPDDVGCLLFGGSSKFSWFQAEAYSGTGSSTGVTGIASFAIDAAFHGSTYVQYAVSGYNVGPYGYSAYTEASPLVC